MIIPSPIIGGTLTVVYGMITVIGIYTLQNTDLMSTRNATILGLSLILGTMVPQWLRKHPGALRTGLHFKAS